MTRRVAAALAGFGALWLSAPCSAQAGSNDLALLNLCEPSTAPRGLLGGAVPECSWVRRSGSGLVESVTFDAEAASRFRSLMSELGVVMAPRLVVPANTLGASGFQVSGEIGSTTISHDQPFWNGVEVVSPFNPTTGPRPERRLSTVGVYLRKGLWIPLPAFEIGGGLMHLVDSQLLSFQAYAKLALHEGFHAWPLPSFAARVSLSYLTGSEQARLQVTGLDLILSKGFGFLKTSRIEPFGGWSFLFITASSLPIDATPSCDAYVVHSARPGTGLGAYCAEAQRGTGNDYLANFSFPAQDTIKRQRFFGGAKLKFAQVFIAAQYEIVPIGRSRDERQANGARDGSGPQETVSLSGGFDF